VPVRFAPQISKLRRALRGKHDAELLAALRREIETLSTPALAADNSTRYIASNSPARALTGFSDSELLELTVMDLTPLARTDEGQRLWQEFIGNGVRRGVYEMRRRDGSTVAVRYWAYASIAPGVHISLLQPVDKET
jgi:PAS domain S-box-containing protein